MTDLSKILGTSKSVEDAAPKADAPKPIQNDLEKTFGAKQVEVESEPDVVAYTSHPIQNFKMGRFRFVNATLKLSPADAEEFDAMLAEQPVIEQTRVRKLDVTAAERIVRENLAKKGGATKAVDSTVGERGIKPLTGTGVLGESGETGEVK